VRDFRQRRDEDEFAEDKALARATVDALLHEVDRPDLPSFAPLHENLVVWLVNHVAPENARKVGYERKAQEMVAGLWGGAHTSAATSLTDAWERARVAKLVKASKRCVQDIVGRSRKYEQVEAPLRFAGWEKMRAAAEKK
jgi:hypothetical protein